jgi:predicted DNA-binding transcriptional regulator YafY
MTTVRISGIIQTKDDGKTIADFEVETELTEALGAFVAAHALEQGGNGGFPAFTFNDPELVRVLVEEACEKHRPITFHYTDAEGARSVRRALAFKVEMTQRYPFNTLVRTFDLDALDNRTFRLDRMERVSKLG